MEIKVNIQKNEYKQPTEIRQEAVQRICDAFLYGGCNRTFHPHDNSVRRATLCAYRSPRISNPDPNKHEDWFYGFENEHWCKDHKEYDYIRFNGAEMKAAFHAIIEAGYFLFRVYSYGGEWKGYAAYHKPEYRDGNSIGEMVFKFTDFID